MSFGTNWLNALDYLTTTEQDDVLSYTGSIDVTAKLQAALDSLTNGGTLFLPPGAYLLNQTAQADNLTINRSNIVLRGSGVDTILKHTATGVVTGNQAIIQIFPNADADISNIEVRDLRIAGPTPNTGALITADARMCGIMIHEGSSPYNVSDVLIQNVTVENTESICFAQTAYSDTIRCQRIRYVECVARNSRWSGFNDFAGSSDDVEYINCTAHDLDGFGFEVASARLLIDGAHVWKTGQSGIGLEYNPTVGVNKWRIIRNCTIHDLGTTAYPHADGISLGQSQVPYNTEISNSLIYRIAGAGININSVSSHIVIRDNTITDVGGGGGTNLDKAGIWFSNTGTNWDVHGNTVRRVNPAYALTYGIAAAGAGNASNVVHGNVVQGATITPITLNAPTQVVGNFT